MVGIITQKRKINWWLEWKLIWNPKSKKFQQRPLVLEIYIKATGHSWKLHTFDSTKKWQLKKATRLACPKRNGIFFCLFSSGWFWWQLPESSFTTNSVYQTSPSTLAMEPELCRERVWRQEIVLPLCRHPTAHLHRRICRFAMPHHPVRLLSPYHAQPTRLRIVNCVQCILRAVQRTVNRHCLVPHRLLFPYQRKFPV